MYIGVVELMLDDFPTWLRGELAKSGMRYIDLAGRLGVSESTVAGWCRGLRWPSTLHLLEMFELFGYRIIEM